MTFNWFIHHFFASKLPLRSLTKVLAALIRVYAVFPEETIEAIDEEGQDSQVKTVANKMCIKFQSSCSSDVDMLLSQVNILLSEINVNRHSCNGCSSRSCGPILDSLAQLVIFLDILWLR